MKNIAILSYSLTSGGAERIAGLLSKYLSQKYNVYLFLHDCSVITYDHKGTIIDLSANGEENIEQTLRESKQKYNIDCAISFLIVMNCLNVRTRMGESVILSNRCSFGEVVPFPYGDSNRIKTWYNEADRIISCAHGAKYDLVHNFGINEELITTIYNFIDKNKIINNSMEPLSDRVKEFIGESKLLLNVGRLDDQKNQHKLLIQFADVLRSGYDVKLIILGSGYLENALKAFSDELGISDKVLFETYCKNPFPYYRAADVMAFSTDYEGLPNVVLESMTLGLPVVSVDCLSGPLELIKGCSDYSVRTKKTEICSRGVLVEQAVTDKTGETTYFANGIRLLLDNEELCSEISENQKKYMENYDNRFIFDSWINVIENTQPRMRCSEKHLLNNLDGAKKVIVYGAGVYGKSIMRYLLKQNNNYDLLCFAVSDKTDNPGLIYDIPVYQIDELTEHKNDSKVVIGVSAKFEKEIMDILQNKGFDYIFSDI